MSRTRPRSHQIPVILTPNFLLDHHGYTHRTSFKTKQTKPKQKVRKQAYPNPISTFRFPSRSSSFCPALAHPPSALLWLILPSVHLPCSGLIPDLDFSHSSYFVSPFLGYQTRYITVTGPHYYDRSSLTFCFRSSLPTYLPTYQPTYQPTSYLPTPPLSTTPTPHPSPQRAISG